MQAENCVNLTIKNEPFETGDRAVLTAATEKITDKDKVEAQPFQESSSTNFVETMLKNETNNIHSENIPMVKKQFVRKLVELDEILLLSRNKLVTFFSEATSDLLARQCTYTCRLMPERCFATFKSYDSDEDAKSSMLSHLEEHVQELVERKKSNHLFTFCAQAVPKKCSTTDNSATSMKRSRPILDKSHKEEENRTSSSSSDVSVNIESIKTEDMEQPQDDLLPTEMIVPVEVIDLKNLKVEPEPVQLHSDHLLALGGLEIEDKDKENNVPKKRGRKKKIVLESGSINQNRFDANQCITVPINNSSGPNHKTSVLNSTSNSDKVLRTEKRIDLKKEPKENFTGHSRDNKPVKSTGRKEKKKRYDDDDDWAVEPIKSRKSTGVTNTIIRVSRKVRSFSHVPGNYDKESNSPLASEKSPVSISKKKKTTLPVIFHTENTEVHGNSGGTTKSDSENSLVIDLKTEEPAEDRMTQNTVTDPVQSSSPPRSRPSRRRAASYDKNSKLIKLLSDDSEEMIEDYDYDGNEEDDNDEEEEEEEIQPKKKRAKRVKTADDSNSEDIESNPIEKISDDRARELEKSVENWSRKEEKEMAMYYIDQLKIQKDRKEIKCKICMSTFTAHATLVHHYRSHAGVKLFVCKVCNHSFTRKHSLKYHKMIHNEVHRFTCEYCNREFRHPSHYKEHLRKHTGETPFHCTDCPNKFKTRNTFKRHMKTRHGKIVPISRGNQATVRAAAAAANNASFVSEDINSSKEQSLNTSNSLEKSITVCQSDTMDSSVEISKDIVPNTSDSSKNLDISLSDSHPADLSIAKPDFSVSYVVDQVFYQPAFFGVIPNQDVVLDLSMKPKKNTTTVNSKPVLFFNPPIIPKRYVEY